MTMEEKLIKKMAICSTLFALVVSIVLFQLPSQGAAETMAEQTADATPVDSDEETMNYYDGDTAESGTNSNVTSYLKIPLPTEVKEDDITIEDVYVNQTIKISINNIDSDFFDNNPLVGSSDHISNVVYGTVDGVVQIELVLDSTYEYDAEYVDNSLDISFIEPKSLYDHVVVIDAGHGSKASGTVHYNAVEKDINLDIVLKLKAILDASDIKAYYTRTDDSNPSFEARANLANNVNADFFISVHNNGDTSASSSAGTEVLYNETEEESAFGSKQLAQICQDSVVSALGTRDRGLVTGSDIYIIRSSKVPVALVEVGFITNKTEAASLSTDSYQQKAAQAIFDAIVKAYDERDSVISGD
ncbi:MAG: N-acetylmuramoyl-L-alanine amidase [Lachnotalea sp.]